MNLTKIKTRMFSGRLSRLGLILGFVYYFVGSVLLFSSLAGLYAFFLGFIPNFSFTALVIPIVALAIVWYAVFVICIASLFVRRCHDLNRPSGNAWRVLLTFSAFGLYLLIAPGNFGENDYGLPMNSRNFFLVTGLR